MVSTENYVDPHYTQYSYTEGRIGSLEAVSNILASAKSFTFISFQNLAVHQLAKLCLKFDSEFEYFDSCPDCLAS